MILKSLKCPVCGETMPYDLPLDDYTWELDEELALQCKCVKCHSEWWCTAELKLGESQLPPIETA